MRIFTQQRRKLNDCCDINIIIMLCQLMRCYIRARRSTSRTIDY
jgi:hypothetical protein